MNISKFKNNRVKVILLYLLCFLIIIISILSTSFPIIFSALLVTIIASWWINKYNSDFVMMYKREIISNLIPIINSKLNYEPLYGINEKIYRDSQFEDQPFNSYYCDDYIFGDIEKNTKINICDIAVKNRNGSGRLEQTDELFYGLFSFTECPNNIHSLLKINRNCPTILKDDSIVNMDSQNFEKYFDVYCENKILAMQLLTPEVMEFIIEFYEKYNIDFEISIINNTIYLRFFTGRMFEARKTGNPIDINLLWKYYNIVMFVIDFSSKINTIVNDLEL